MGKSRKSPKGTAQPTTADYSEQNKAILQPIIDKLEKEYNDEKTPLFRKKILEGRIESLKDFLDYCDKNNLELVESKSKTWNTYGNSHEFTPKLSIKDHNNGLNYNVYDETNERLGAYTDRIDKIRSTLNDFPTKFTKGLEDVNIVSSHPDILRDLSANGNFYPGTHSIQLSYGAFDSMYWATGIEGTIAHELGHHYDWWVLGKGEAYGSSIPGKTPFGKYGINTENEIGPTKYATNTPNETTSTVFEQVYTKTLRQDAMMKDGKSVSAAYLSEYGKNGTPEELYNYWKKEWSDIVTPAEKALEK